MKITFLGTNGWYDTETGNTPCVLVQTGTEHIILDAGFGFYKLARYITDDLPIILLISHLHLDHLIGLHTLPIFRYAQGIDIYTQPGTRDTLASLIAKPFTKPLESMVPLVRLHEYTETSRFPFGFEARELLHAVPCFGFRVTSGGKTVSFCTDTEDCPNLRALAKDADLLITECAFRADQETKGSFHLNPPAAATAAREASVKQLALFHFDPGRYPALADRKVAESEARKIFPETTATIDGYEMVLD